MIKIIQTPINGQPMENTTPNAVLSALNLFYKAFNEGNLDLMQQSWDHSSEVAMDNPLGGITRGWKAIEAVYKRIFEGKAEVFVEFYDYTIHENGETCYVVGRERGYFQAKDQKLDLAIRTSRIFKRVNGDWKQVHHHGSIEDPQLLQTYQTLVQ